MEKALDGVIEGTTNTQTVPNSTLGSAYDLDLSELEVNNTEDNSQTEADDNVNGATQSSQNIVATNPTNAAFAQMRTRNKELEGIYSELDTIAKSVGLASAEDFISKAKAQRNAKEAEARGVSAEINQELKALNDEIKALKTEREQEKRAQKEKSLAQVLQGFVKDNNLSNSDVNNLGNALDGDGLSMEVLMNMTRAAQKKIFKAYYGKDNSNQKQLERKNAIKNELPISQTSKAPIDLNKEIDDLAKIMAGKL